MKGAAPGKIILFGEHAVVYGEPAIAAPLSKKVVVTARPGTGKLDVRLPRGTKLPAEHRAAGPAALLERALGDLSVLDVRVDLGVAPMAGFGSSAALAVAALIARGVKGNRRLLDRALAVEAVAHGRPSGIDPATAIWAQPIRFERRGDDIRVRKLAFEPFHLVIGTAGVHGGTAPVVAQIGELREAAPKLIGSAMSTLGEAARAGATGLKKGDAVLVGRAMRIANGVLDALGLVGDPVKDALAHLHAAGAEGAKMSGAGGTGGAFVAIFGSAATARRGVRALAKHGIHAWHEPYGV